jgi:hypothetical protein
MNLIAWFGKEFMRGSGYEKRLHEELIELRKRVQLTNILLTCILENMKKGSNDNN